MKSRVWFGRLVAATLLVAALAPASHAVFNIVVTYAAGTTPTPSQAAAFSSAEARWESLIADYLTPTARANIPALNITATLANIDGVGGTLGSAGPRTVVRDGNRFIANSGVMTFDTSDTAALEADGSFNNVILHEMAHVMGLGTLWGAEFNPGVYSNFQYTGSFALTAYRAEFFQPTATFIPVEQSGGSGTAGAHWAEVTPNTSAIRDAQGRPLTQELMTGFLDDGAYISNMTVESFRDIGYLPRVVVIPEVGTMGLLAAGIGALGTVTLRRRKK